MLTYLLQKEMLMYLLYGMAFGSDLMDEYKKVSFKSSLFLLSRDKVVV